MRWSVMSPLRIALLDDHALIREALKIRLSLEPDFKVTGIFTTSNELMEGLSTLVPDLLVLDYQLTDAEIDGLRLIQSIRARHPELRILIFSSMDRPATVNLCIRAGAKGFVGKSQPTEELLAAIRTVALDRMSLPATTVLQLETPPQVQPLQDGQVFEDSHDLLDYPNLSPKEREVLRCILQGMSGADIAIKFARSRKTISGQKQAVFRKLGITTDAELFKLNARLKDL